MYTAIVEFNTLPDPVGASAQDHDLWFIRADRIFVFTVVGGIVISVILRAADMNAFPCFLHTQGNSLLSYLVFCDIQNLA